MALLIAALLMCDAARALSYTERSVVNLSTAHGYLLGQRATLARIGEHFPDLALDIRLAESAFTVTFPGIEAKLLAQLEAAMGRDLAAQVQQKALAEIAGLLDRQQLSREIARGFLGQVHERAEGDIPSPVLETLLTVQYESDPRKEYLDRFRQRFETDGRGKSRGVRLRLQLPRSWAQAEGERPHIVSKWQSENGFGSSLIMLDIREATGYRPTRRDMQELIESREFVPDGFEVLDAGAMTLEMAPGLWFDVTGELERGGLVLRQFARMNQVFVREKAIGIQCMTTVSPENANSGRATFAQIVALCELVVNSLVLLDQY